MRALRSAGRAWLFAPAGPGAAVRLGWVRLLFCLGLLGLYGTRDFGLWAEVDPAFVKPFLLLGLWAPPVADAGTLTAMTWLFRASLVCGTLGLVTRPALGVAAALSFYLLGLEQQFGKLHHMDGPVVLLLIVLAASRCGDAVSLDARWRRGDATGRPERRARLTQRARAGAYTWPARAGPLVLVTVFFAAGVAKLRNGGVTWAWSDTMTVATLKSQYDATAGGPATGLGLLLLGVPWLARPAAAGALLLELSYPATLFSRRLRWVIVPGTLLLLLAIRLTMGPRFGTFMLAHVFWLAGPGRRPGPPPVDVTAGSGPAAPAA